MFLGITATPLKLDEINASFEQSIRGAGAVVTFVGYVRDFNLSGNIDGLELEHYPGMTEKSIKSLAKQTIDKFSALNVGIVHRVGRIPNHDPIVWVGAAALHRQSAFDAAMYSMDVLKKDVPLWKKEWRDNEAEWVEAKASDADALQRWRKNTANTQLKTDPERSL